MTRTAAGTVGLVVLTLANLADLVSIGLVAAWWFRAARRAEPEPSAARHP
ncbi:hypothetical protein [Actinomycetospora sp. TBRC 11914]|nr:hypothetical protein [Actinomycetospora sp. TBRC 11914]NMO88947.1 hypothetical protein [Actinomycetospora sp. TBRC 11914]